MKYDREKKIERCIRLVWESLESHLIYTYQPEYIGRAKAFTPKHHKQCVHDYAEVIKLLSELY